MADRARSRRRLTSSNRWDESNPNNWTTERYIEELAKLGIRVPANIGKVVMKKLYLEYRGIPPTNTDAWISVESREEDVANAVIVPPSTESITENNNRIETTRATNSSETPSGEGSRSNASTNVASGSRANLSNMAASSNSDIICSMLNTMQSMQQTVLGLQNTVMSLVAEKKSSNTDDHSLDTAMAAIRQQPAMQGPTTGGYTLPRNEFGVPSDSLTHLDVVTEKLRKTRFLTIP